MDQPQQQFISRQDLARRWGRTECAIGLASALGAGPRYVKVDGGLQYPVDEVRQYEKDYLLFDPEEVAGQSR